MENERTIKSGFRNGIFTDQSSTVRGKIYIYFFFPDFLDSAAAFVAADFDFDFTV